MTSKPESLAIYSNRPPVDGLVGGVVRVISASNPDIWIGPSSKAIDDDKWKAMTEEERHQLTCQEVEGAEGLKIYTFPVPIGASDILGGTRENPGAFVIQTTREGSDNPTEYLTQKLADVFDEIVGKSKTVEGRQELEARYDVMSDASRQYSAEHFGDVVLEAVRTRQRFADSGRDQSWAGRQ